MFLGQLGWAYLPQETPLAIERFVEEKHKRASLIYFVLTQVEKIIPGRVSATDVPPSACPRNVFFACSATYCQFLVFQLLAMTF